MNQRATRVPWSLIAGALLAGGCYAYVPVSPATPEPGATVIADLSESGATGVTSTLGPGVRSITGMIYEKDQQNLGIVVSSYTTARSGELSGGGEPLRIQIAEIQNLQQKQLSRGRSVLLGALFLGGAVTLTTILVDDGRKLDDQVDEEPGPIQDIVPSGLRPLLRFTLPLFGGGAR